MGIVYPSKAVAARWNGALEARLRRAPLEAFLLGCSLEPATIGRSRDTDNLSRATMCIVRAGLQHYLHQEPAKLAFNQRSAVAHAACLVSLALAQQISNEVLWHHAALVSSSKVLAPFIGLNSAAIVSATVARGFQREIAIGLSPLDWRISKSAREAVSANTAASLARAASNIAARLHAEPPLTLIAAPRREALPR